MPHSTTELTVSQPASKKWIAGRVMTLLSHYYQPDTPEAVFEEAVKDWIKALDGHPQERIEAACQAYLKSQPRRRPAPGDILSRMQAGPQATGDERREKLTFDERVKLDEVLATARAWAVSGNPVFADHGIQTLRFWGEA